MKTRLLFCALILANSAFSQDFLRFSGVVLDQERIAPVEGTYIFNSTKGREAVTDSLGFFSIEAGMGDTLVFRDLRYVPSTFVVPPVFQQDADYGLIQMLTPTTLMLDEVRVFSFPTEEEFREVFMKASPQPNMESRALEAKRDIMKAVRESYKEDKYYYEMWADRRVYELTGQIPPNHFLDPFRWTEFIRSLKEESGE